MWEHDERRAGSGVELALSGDLRGCGDGESGFFSEFADGDLWRDDDERDTDGKLESEV